MSSLTFLVRILWSDWLWLFVYQIVFSLVQREGLHLKPQTLN